MTTAIENPTITLTSDITGEAYLSLLDVARRTQSLIGLVWREQLTFSPSARQVAVELEPSLVEERLTDEWPGTRLFGSHAWYRLYRCDEHSIPVLARVGRLFGWRAPDHPEDPSFHLSTGELWLTTISHESQGRFDTATLGEAAADELVRLAGHSNDGSHARS